MRAAKAIPHPDDLGYAEWVRVGMAFYAASHGSTDGAEAFDEWSAKWEGYQEGEPFAKWLDLEPDEITPGSLVHFVRETDPNFRPSKKSAMEAFAGLISKPESAGDPFTEPTEVPKVPRVKSFQAFRAGYEAPSFLIDGVIQHNRVYAISGNTGHGKTAVALCLSLHVARGMPLAGREVDKGRVLYLAAENPDDVIGRLVLASYKEGIGDEEVDMHFLPGAFDLVSGFEDLEAEMEALGGVDLVVVDTGAAFIAASGVDDENDNMALLGFAHRLRDISNGPGKPCVVALMHPKKGATRDDLSPRGGSAFMNDVDGVLGCWAAGDRSTAQLFTGAGLKLRGSPFEPLAFALEADTCPDLTDTKDRLVPAVWARPISADEAKGKDDELEQDCMEVLNVLGLHNAGLAVRALPRELRWVTKSGAENHSRARRAVDQMLKDKRLERRLGAKGPVALTAKTRRELGALHQTPEAHSSARAKFRDHTYGDEQ